jgi:hypothetical protein
MATRITPTPRLAPCVEPDRANIQGTPKGSFLTKLPLGVQVGVQAGLILAIGFTTALGVRSCLNTDSQSQSEIPEPTPVEGSQSTE